MSKPSLQVVGSTKIYYSTSRDMSKTLWIYPDGTAKIRIVSHRDQAKIEKFLSEKEVQELMYS